MARTTRALVACGIVSFGLGTFLGVMLAGGTVSRKEESPSASAPDPRLQNELEEAKRRLGEQDRLIADLQRRSGPGDASAPATKEAPAGEKAGAGTDEEGVPLPGSPAGTATFSTVPGDQDWQWVGAVNPDRGQASSKAFSTSVRVQPERGSLSIMITLDPEEDSVRCSGFVARKLPDAEKWKVVLRTAGAAEGLSSWGGNSGSFQRARDMARIWQEVAGSTKVPVAVPSVLGCSTLQFRVGGVAYTLITCVEYGPDGNLLGVTCRDGR